MTDNTGSILSHSATGQTRKEARRAKEDASKHFDRKETIRHREAIASFGTEAREARTRRKEGRAEAKQKCTGYVTDAKEKNRDKPPHRRRAELAKARTDCAFDLMNVEERAAQELEAIGAKRDEEVTRRRSSRIATRHNRDRTKERTRSTAREQREEMFDQVRNDLDPGVLPYFEQIKGSAAFKKLVDGGRMTPTEAVLHMAHEDPEAVFLALERQAEKELQELLREQERWEYEGGRPAEGEGESAGAPIAEADGATAKDGEAAPGKRRRAANGRKVKDGDTSGGARRKSTSKGRASARARSDKEQDDIDLERFEDEGGRPLPESEARAHGRERAAASAASEAHAHGRAGDGAPERKGAERRKRAGRTRRGAEPRGKDDAPPVGLDRDGDDWIAFTWAESQRFKSRPDAVGWLHERGFKPDGTPLGAPEDAMRSGAARAEDNGEDENDSDEIDSPESEAPASGERDVPASHARTPGSTDAIERAARMGAPVRDELTDVPRPCCGPHARELVGEPEAHGAHAREPAAEPAPHAEHARGAATASTLHSAHSTRRPSAEERTLWMPGTGPARPSTPDPAPRVRMGLFEDEADTLPETPDAKRRQGEQGEESSAKKRDPVVQQAFGTDFTSWLNQAGPQLTLDSAPARPAPRAAAPTTITSAASARSSSPREAASMPPSAPHEAANARRDVGSSAADGRSVMAPTPAHPSSAAPTMRAEPLRAWSREYTGASLHVDPVQRSLQVRFDDMPDAQLRIALRTAGFRWAPAVQRWQAPLDDERRLVAEAVLTEHANVVEARRARRGVSGRASRAAVTSQDAGADTDVVTSDDQARAEGASAAEGEADAQSEEHGADPTEERRNAYEQKRADRVARLHARADALQAASAAVYNDARAKADRIPFGQPILVGHHSEGRDRRFRAKIHQGYGKAFELEDQAKALRRRAEAAEKSDAISSDDPDAIAKLEAKVKERGDFIYRARHINEILRSARSGRKTGWEPIAVQRLIAIGVAPAEAEKLTKKDFAGRIGIPGYATRNAQGEIARLNRRIEELRQRDARPVRAPERIGEAVIVEDRDANRVQIRFDDLPPKELRNHLRGRGFVWAPSAGAWQRKLNDNALWTARDVLRSFYPRKPEVASAANEAPPAPAAAPDEEPEREPGLDSDPYVPDETASGDGAKDGVPF